MNEKQVAKDTFYTHWKERRKKKYRYMFWHGAVLWGIPTGVLYFLFYNHFGFGNTSVARFFFAIAVFVVVGFNFGYRSFRRKDQKYLEEKRDRKIRRGLALLEAGEMWNYGNLLLYRLDDSTLVVRNRSFWLDDSTALGEKLDECLQLVTKDFKRLKKNVHFEEFIDGYTIKARVFSNANQEKPLLEVSL